MGSSEVCQTKLGALEEEVESSVSTLRALAKHQALLAKLAASENDDVILHGSMSTHDAQMLGCLPVGFWTVLGFYSLYKYMNKSIDVYYVRIHTQIRIHIYIYTHSFLAKSLIQERFRSRPRMQELVLDLTSRVSSLETVERSGPGPREAALPAEEFQVKPLLQQLEAGSQRLHREMLDVLAKLEEHSVHLASCRSRMDVLEDQHRARKKAP